MSDELREKVARVNCAGVQWDKPCKVPCVDCLREADAAIVLVRAEVAKGIREAAKTSPYARGMTQVFVHGLGDGYEAAAQIAERAAPHLERNAHER